VEPKVLGRVPADPPATLVDQAVVGVTQEHEIVQVGPSTFSPVDDVMSLHPPPSLASWESTPAVAVTEQPGDRAGDRPAAASDPHHAISGMENPLDPRVACEAADGFAAQALPGVSLREPWTFGGLLSGEHFGAGVHDQGRHRRRLVRRARNQLDKSIG
jgi:hypothetical protein